MAEHLSDDWLANRLEQLGESVAFPDPPDLTAAVRSRLAVGEPTARPRWFAGAAVKLAMAGAAALVAVVLVVAPVRSAVADLLGIGAVRVTVGEEPIVVDSKLALGGEITLAAATEAVPFPLLVPDLAALGEPDGVYFSPTPSSGQVSLVWGARDFLVPVDGSDVDLLITQFAAELEAGFFEKILGDGSVLEPVEVRGVPGFWISGAPHAFLYRDAEGNVAEGILRLAANTLLWEEGGVTIRIESNLGLEESLEVAAGLG